MPQPHLERVLFVVGMPNAGKSRLLRSMFVDHRLGTKGKVPEEAKIKLVAISRERCLFVRCTSPHEYQDTQEKFFRKLQNTMNRACGRFRRFNFACALQPRATKHTPDVATICQKFTDRFGPERIRIIQMHPRQDGKPGDLLQRTQINKLRRLNVEVLTIDGRRPAADSHISNGLLLADFFDFI